MTATDTDIEIEIRTGLRQQFASLSDFPETDESALFVIVYIIIDLLAISVPILVEQRRIESHHLQISCLVRIQYK